MRSAQTPVVYLPELCYMMWLCTQRKWHVLQPLNLAKWQLSPSRASYVLARPRVLVIKLDSLKGANLTNHTWAGLPMINSCIGSIILSCGGGIKSVPDSLVTFVPNLVFVTFAPFNLYVNVEKGAQKRIDILNTIRTCKQSLSTIHFCSICVCVCSTEHPNKFSQWTW